jgi:hypothetical protein
MKYVSGELASAIASRPRSTSNPLISQEFYVFREKPERQLTPLKKLLIEVHATYHDWS